MAVKNGTIYFYQLQLQKDLHRKLPDGTFAKEYVSSDIFFEEFIQILTNNLNVNSAFNFGDEFTFELIDAGDYITSINKFNNKKLSFPQTKYIFAKLGRKQDLPNVHRRNNKTLKANDINKEIDEFFEFYTYFYMFYEINSENKPVVTIAFLRSQAAPYIRTLSLLAQIMRNPDYIIKIEPIITQDGLAVLMNKSIINTINYSISLPTNDELVRDIYGINDEDTFAALTNLHSLDISFSLKGDRGKNIIEDKKVLSIISKNLKSFAKNKNGKKVSISASAKDDGTKMIEYDFFDNMFISKAQFDIIPNVDWEDTVKETMHQYYIDMRRDLLNFVR